MSDTNFIYRTDNEKIRQSEICHFATNIEKISNKYINNSNNIISVQGTPQKSTQYLLNLVQKTPGIDILMQLTPAQVSYFVPNFKLYKSYKVSSEDSAKVYNFEYDFPTFINPQDIRDITDGTKGTYRASGVKSIKLDINPSNMYLANRTVKVNMSIFCNTLEDLIEPMGYYSGELVGHNKGKEGKKDFIRSQDIDLEEIRNIKIMDLIYVTGGGVSSENSSNNPFYTTKLSLGWGIPENINESGLFDNINKEDLITALKATRINVDLKYVNHSFDLQESGYITLDVEFIGALDHTMLSADILASDRHRIIKTLLAEMLSEAPMEEKEEEEKKATIIKLLNFAKDAMIDSTREVLINAMRAAMSERYSYILDSLQKSNKIYEEYFDDILDKDKKKTEKDSRSVSRPLGTGGSLDREGGMSYTPVTHQIPVAPMVTMPPYTEPATESGALSPAREAATLPEDAPDTDSIVPQLTPKKDRRVSYYMFLGDLLDVVMSETKSNRSFKIMLGSVSYMLQSRTGNKVRKVCIPMASIPIPLTLFNIYFIENITKPQRTSMTFTEFITGIFESAAKAIITKDCSNEDADINNMSVVYSQIEIARKKRKPKLTEKSYTIEQIEGLFENEWEMARYYASGDHETDLYLLVNASSHTDFTTNLKGDVQEDKGRGIYHFSWGLNRGILKKLRFSKTEVPKMRESRVTSNEPSDPLSRFKEPYDADIEFIGPCFLYPGQIHYINPKFIGAGDPRARNTLARKLLMGGYYAAVGSTITFAPGDLSCSTRMIWQGSGKLIDNKKESTNPNNKE